MTLTTKTVLATAAAALIIAPAYAAHIKDGRKLDASLDGASEVPGPGDPDGSGTFVSRTNPGQGEICYNLTVIDIEQATAAHIHAGAAGEAGPVVVTLATPDENGMSGACAEISKGLAQRLIRFPQNYYINVHNAEFPPGAVRGQLSK